jgi:hypothetical protein
MGLSKPADKVIFADSKVETHFNSLSEDDWLKKALKRAIEDFKENAFCGERIKKELIPKEYIKKYGIDNLLWYPLPNAWRLVYSIFSDKMELFVMIVEYYDHKEYERRFHY